MKQKQERLKKYLAEQAAKCTTCACVERLIRVPPQEEEANRCHQPGTASACGTPEEAVQDGGGAELQDAVLLTLTLQIALRNKKYGKVHQMFWEVQTTHQRSRPY